MSTFADVPAPARRELLMIPRAPASVRADAIGEDLGSARSTRLAEALMDLEADEVARGAAIEELKALDESV